MRFHRIDLIKYGKFSGRSIEFPRACPARNDFHLIIGPNEAGKSTLRSAILDVLFGIPTRSPLAFLHPLNELRLGAHVGNHAAALEFHRAKAQKQTLRSPADAVLPDTALAPFLGTADRGFFDQMFGLDHSRLVAGGNSILSAENDVGRILFQSAAGVAGLGKIRDALLAEAEKLWAPKKAANRAYYIGAEQLDKATAAMKEATVRTRVWAEASAQLEKVKEKLGIEQDRLRQLQLDRSRLERVRRAAPFLRALRESESQLSRLGEVPELAPDAAAVLDMAQRELATAGQTLVLRTEELARTEQALAQIRVDEHVLALAADIAAVDALRLQYSGHESDIALREREAAALWQEIVEACKQLGWKIASEEALAARLPTLLVRRELGQLARSRSGLMQAVTAAEQAVRVRQAEVDALSRQLAQVRMEEIRPGLRVALAKARSLGDTDAALQKQQHAAGRAQAALEAALQALGRWSKAMPELTAMQPPSRQRLARLAQDRQTLAADARVASKRAEEQKAQVAALELDVLQYEELHRPTTQEAVRQARRERDAFWNAIKSGDTGPEQGARRFETAMAHADALADTRLDHVEEATELQSRRHRLERERQALLALQQESRRVDADLSRFDLEWEQTAAALGLPGIALDDIGDWLAKREKVLECMAACEEAGGNHETVSQAVSECRRNLAGALREQGLCVADDASLSALCVQAEHHIQVIDGARVRHETLSSQLLTAQSLAGTLQRALEDAQAQASHWFDEWTHAVARAGLPEASNIVTVEGALELISGIEEKLARMRQIRIERIDVMRSQLNELAAQADRLAQAVAPELSGAAPSCVAQELSARLTGAREASSQVRRLREVLDAARAQADAARESIRTAKARLRPLLERAGVDSHAALSEAIARSDQRRALNDGMLKAGSNLIDSGDGLTREQIEAEVDAADLGCLAADIAHLDEDMAEAVRCQNSLSAEARDAMRVLAGIGGSDAAARAEAERQEAIAQMSDAAERYIKVFTAARLLRWSTDRYREEKQGPMLARAGAIFAKLSGGSFRKLVVDFDAEPMTLEGLRYDGKLVGVSGMSDGTRDQLYLALRLSALELHLEQAPPLPFVADDLFINYDDTRSKAGFEALAALSEKTQVIYLSHHDHLVPVVRDVFGEQVNIVFL